MKMQLEYLNDDGIDILCWKTLSWTHTYVDFFVAVYLLFCDDGLNFGCYGIVKDYGVSGLNFETINPNSHQELWFS